MASPDLDSDGQRSELVQDQTLGVVPEVTIPGQDQTLQEHEHTQSDRGKEAATEEIQNDSCVISIKEKLNQAHRDHGTKIWRNLCIYRVPQYMRENDHKLYIPQTVSIGPYHHGKDDLMPMESHKWRAVGTVLKRTEHSIEMYVDAMRNLEEHARACYEGPIDLDSNQFTEMLVLDGCFVLELFMGNAKGFTEIGYSPNDPVFAIRGMMQSFIRDMILLENQLPMFVLERLLELQLGAQYQTDLVARLAIRFFDPLMPTGGAFTEPMDNFRDGHLHCLDAFRLSLWHSPEQNLRISTKERWTESARLVEEPQQQAVYCATQLSEAGIKFKRRGTDLFSDIRFKKGCLEIPKLQIHDGTESLFYNLIAFEQCHANAGDNITSYIVFMGSLINSYEDVSYLKNCGIIQHFLRTDAEVADLFDRLGKNVVFNWQDSYLSEVSHEVNRYSNRRRNKYAWVFPAAAIGLLLTLIQTVFTVIAYFKPPT